MGSSRIGGWLVSCGAVVLVMVAFVDLKPHLQPEKFQWDVVLLQAPAPSPVTSAEVQPQETVPPAMQPQPQSQKVQPPAQPLARTIERTPVVKNVQAVESVKQVVERSPTQDLQAVTTRAQVVDKQPIHTEAIASAQEPVRQDVREVEQVAEQSISVPVSRALVNQEKPVVVE